MRGSRGITVLEVIIGVFVGSLIIVALVRFMALGFPVSRTGYFQTRANEEARVHLRRLSKAIREVRTADTGAYAISVAEPNRLIFHSDVDNDGLTERIRYELVEDGLERGVLVPSGDPVVYDEDDEVSAVVASFVRNDAMDPIFSYYDGDYPAVLDPLDPVDVTQVKYIEFDLIIDVEEQADPPALELQSQVQVRNLKTNLAE